MRRARFCLPRMATRIVSTEGGIEERQYGAGGGQTTPIFRVGLDFRPLERTTLSVETSRRTYSSALLTGQNYVATGISTTVRQQLFARWNLSLGAGYED